MMVDPHVKFIRPVAPRAEGCEDCLRTGSPWAHLRLCLTCGHVGCCDSSPNRHARKHFFATGIRLSSPSNRAKTGARVTSTKPKSEGEMECWHTGVMEYWV
jgi:Zn-finger in ubiquitin-hydrolases and other protein